MAVYILLLITVAAVGFLLCERQRSAVADRCFLIATAAVLILIAALRSHTVGVDTIVYINHFSAMVDSPVPSGFEPGYRLLVWLISRLTSDVSVFLGISSGVIIGLRFIFIACYSKISWVSAVLYIALGFFGYALCTLRQELAISIGLFSLPFLQKRKPLCYISLVLLAAAFHYSLLVLLPVYLIAWIPINKISLCTYGLFVLLAMLFSEPALAFITGYVYKSYQPNSYYTLGRNYATVIFPLMLFAAALLLRKPLLQRSPANIVLINFSLYSAALFCLTLRHFVFQRVALIFFPVSLLLVPAMLCCAFPTVTCGQLPETNRKDKQQQKQLRSLYYTSLWLTLFGAFIYFMFLLSSNRLKLVPYLFA